MYLSITTEITTRYLPAVNCTPLGKPKWPDTYPHLQPPHPTISTIRRNKANNRKTHHFLSDHWYQSSEELVSTSPMPSFTTSSSPQIPAHPTKLHRHSVQDEASEFAVATSSSTYAIAEEEFESESEERTLRGRLRDIMSDNQMVINTFIAGTFMLGIQEKPEIKLINNLGGLAGAASRTVVSPLERLKIILCA